MLWCVIYLVICRRWTAVSLAGPTEKPRHWMVRLPGNMPDGSPVASELGRKADTRERGRNYGTSRPPFLLLWVGRWAKTHEKETPENRLGKAVILGHLTLLLSCLSFSLHFFNKTPPTCQSLLPFRKVKVSSCFGGSGVIPSPFDLGHLQLSSSRDRPALLSAVIYLSTN